MNEKVTIQDIIDLLCEKHGTDRKDAELFVKGMFDLIEEALATEKYVKVKGLGTFKLTEVDSRESVNVNTGERIEIQSHTKISFTPDSTMKELINKPFAHFETVILNEGVELEDTQTEERPVVIDEKTDNAQTLIEEPIVAETEPINVDSQIVVEEQIVPDTTTEIIEESSPSVLTEEPQPTITEEEPKPIIIDEKITDEKKSSYLLWGIIALLVLIVLFGIYWLFIRPDISKAPVSSTPQELAVTKPVLQEKPSDTIVTTSKEIIETVPLVTTPVQPSKDERVPSLSDTLEYRIIGTKTHYTLKNGETIIKASVKLFGSKKFWPYIVKHNQDIISDADNIPAGISIKIPELQAKK